MPLKPILKHSIALALLLLLQTSLLAQQYPVQANLNVVTPCPNKLSSFFPLSGSRLNLSLLLTDITQAEVQVRLYVKIEGAGLTIQSQPNPSLPVFTLQGGVPLTLGQQIEPYFRTANLLATGNGALQFLQNGVLPEGFFTITITVIEHRRNVQISNPANTYAWIIVNDPPQLVTPSNNQTLEPGGIQNIFISWIPRHVVNPTSGSQISYNLSLWEVPQGFDPQMVVNTLQPLETVSSYSPNVIWGPDKTALTPGKRYVVAVKAIDPNNEVTFKNNGFSAAHSFVYGQPCLTPINLSHSNVFIQTADVAWYALGAAQNFRVEFKAASEANDAWRNLDVNQTNTTISNLAPNTQYNYRVSAVCGGFVSNPTANRSFTTLSLPPLSNECTSDISVPQPDESPLLSSLPFGQVIMAAGFMVEVGVTTQPTPYTFNGNGIITLPLYNFAVKANLKGIQVNRSLHMVSGIVEAQHGDSLTLVGGPGTTTGGPGSVDFSNPNDTVFLSAPIDSVYMNDDGTWTVVNTDGDTTVITPGEGGTMVVDEDGNGVVIVGEEIYTVSDVFNDDPNGNGSGGADSGDGSVGTEDNSNFDEVAITDGSKHYISINDLPTQFKTGNSIKLEKNTQQKLLLKINTLDSIALDKNKIRWKINSGSVTTRHDSVLFVELSVSNSVNIQICSLKKDTSDVVTENDFFTFMINVVSSPYAKFQLTNNYNGEFGFDDGFDFNNLPIRKSLYDAITLSDEQKVFSPLITLKRNQPIALKVSVLNFIEGDSVFFRSTTNKILLNFNYTDSILHVTNTNLENTFENPDYISVYRKSKYGLQEELIGRCEIVSRSAISHNVQIVNYRRDSTTTLRAINTVDLQNSLSNNSMNQAFKSIIVNSHIHEILDTSQIAKQISSPLSAYLRTRGLFQLALNDTVNNILKGNTIYVIITDFVFQDGNGNYKGGGVLNNSAYAIMWDVPNTLLNSHGFSKIIIHEGGHSLGLKDTFNDTIIGQPLMGFSRNNYMDYIPPNDMKMFFKSQLRILYLSSPKP